MPDRLLTGTIDAELAPGARNAIRVCLRLEPEERITIITDEATVEIAAALQAEVEDAGAEYAVFILENYGDRPLKGMPQIVLDDLAHSQVSIFAAQTQPGELGSRMQMSDVVNKRHIRHAHMVNINREIMLEGMRADFQAYTNTDENSNRVGEFAIGTNTACTHVIGNILQDEKIPGVHIAFGHPYAEHTGANWKSKTHIDCVGRDFDIWFDDEQVMEQGKFLI